MRFGKPLAVAAAAVTLTVATVAIATGEFSDVRYSNVFRDDITWLAEAGVTKGCNPPDNTAFCPDDNVTREQMAAFLHRFSQYIDAEDGTPALADRATTAADADALNGLKAPSLSYVEGWTRDGDSGGNTITIGPEPSQIWTADTWDRPGELVVVLYGYYASGGTRFSAWLQTNNELCENGKGEPGTLYFQEPDEGELGTVGGSAVFPMRGLDWVTLCADTLTGTTEVRDAYLHLLFFHGGGATVVPGGSTPGTDEVP